MKSLDVKNWLEIGALALGGFVVYRVASSGVKTAKEAGAAIAKVVTEDLNPASDKNIVYSGISSVGSAMTGNSDWTLGGAVYDSTHSDTGESLGYWDWVKKFWGFGSPTTSHSNVSTQGAQIASAAENFRAGERKAQKDLVLMDMTGTPQIVYDQLGNVISSGPDYQSIPLNFGVINPSASWDSTQ